MCKFPRRDFFLPQFHDVCVLVDFVNLFNWSFCPSCASTRNPTWHALMGGGGRGGAGEAQGVCCTSPGGPSAVLRGK